MAAIILGKHLLNDDELIEYAFSDMNVNNHNLVELRHCASDAAITSSLLLIRVMKHDRLFIQSSGTKPAPRAL